ncbi:hypothetical protein HJA82_29315 [Rhizobium bangladeshense]|uniref:hypothetical protein n=1 Tax=Rhizobium TaxID=379 RepID=UPI001C8307B5|nr:MULTISPECIES: hypothetical protein [Rhizobium]MBX4911415.1 hypothetical protein [Rhizobium bangladeshense]MBX5130709.1 hypothetical protein [Rhizobium lentis]
MQLYSITYDQVTLISVFDSKGKKTGDREERVRVSMHDLPLQTAQMYRGKMSGLNFVMTAQTAISSEQPRSHKRDRRDYGATSKSAAARPAQPSKQQQINQAAASGDMTAAINNGSK